MNYRLLLRIGRKKTNFYGPIFLLPVEDKIGFKTQKSVQNRQNDDFSSPGWKYRRTGYVQFSPLGQNKMSAYCVYDLKSCRSYMIRLIIKGR